MGKYPFSRIVFLFSSAAVFTIGLITLLSYWLNLPSLRGFRFESLQTKPNTAVGFLMAAVALALLTLAKDTRIARRVGKSLGLCCLLLGAASVYGNLTHQSFWIDDFLIQLFNGPFSNISGRMVLATAVNLCLFGTCVLLLDYEYRPGRGISEILSLLIALVPYLVLASYGSGVDSQLKVGRMPLITQMSPYVAAGWIFLTSALISCRPQRTFARVLFTPSSTGKMLRIALAAAATLPLGLSWIVGWGGWYEIYHPGFTSSVLILICTLFFISVIWSSMANVLEAEADLLKALAEQKAYEEKLRQQALELKRSNEALERFASVVSHDLKEPLRTVSLFLGMLRKTSDQFTDERSREYIQTAIDGADRMKSLIDGLQQYSALGKEQRVSQPVCLDQVLHRTLANLKALIHEAGAEITSCPLPIVKGNEILIGQLLQNLLSNSLKYRESHHCKIEIDCHRANEFYTIVISDNGIGFDPRLSEKIFQPFQRLPAAMKHPGAGLGLSTCRLIAQEHGGSIWATSTPGKGARFYVTLPVPDPNFLAQSPKILDAHVSI